MIAAGTAGRSTSTVVPRLAGARPSRSSDHERARRGHRQAPSHGDAPEAARHVPDAEDDDDAAPSRMHVARAGTVTCGIVDRAPAARRAGSRRRARPSEPEPSSRIAEQPEHDQRRPGDHARRRGLTGTLEHLVDDQVLDGCGGRQGGWSWCSSVPPLRELGPPTGAGRGPCRRKIAADQRRRRDEEHDQRLDDVHQVDRRRRCVDCICTPPACSAPNSRPASEGAPRLGPAEQGDGDGVEADAGVDVTGELACWCRGSG